MLNIRVTYSDGKMIAHSIPLHTIMRLTYEELEKKLTIYLMNGTSTEFKGDGIKGIVDQLLSSKSEDSVQLTVRENSGKIITHYIPVRTIMRWTYEETDKKLTLYLVHGNSMEFKGYAMKRIADRLSSSKSGLFSQMQINKLTQQIGTNTLQQSLLFYLTGALIGLIDFQVIQALINSGMNVNLVMPVIILLGLIQLILYFYFIDKFNK